MHLLFHQASIPGGRVVPIPATRLFVEKRAQPWQIGEGALLAPPCILQCGLPVSCWSWRKQMGRVCLMRTSAFGAIYWPL